MQSQWRASSSVAVVKSKISGISGSGGAGTVQSIKSPVLNPTRGMVLKLEEIFLEMLCCVRRCVNFRKFREEGGYLYSAKSE